MLKNVELGRLVEQEHQRERARRAACADDARRSKGVAWSGLGPEPQRPRHSVSIEAAARAEWRRLHAWRASAQGRFLTAMAAGQRAAERAHLAGESARAALAADGEQSARLCLTAAEALETEGRALVAAAQTARRALGVTSGPAQPAGAR